MSAHLVWHSLRALFLSLMVGGVLSSFALPSVVWAQDASAVTSSDEERYQANLRRWQSMTEEERQAIRDKAAAMSESDRAVLKEKAKEYRAMPDQQREALRENYRKFRELPPERREALEQGSRGFRQLPPEKCEEVRRRYQEQRKEQGGSRQEPVMRKDAVGSENNLKKTLPDQKGPEKGPDRNKELHDRRPPPPDQKGQGQGRKGQMRRDNGCDDSDKPCIKNAPSDNPRKGGQIKADRPQPRRDPPSARGPQNRRK